MIAEDITKESYMGDGLTKSFPFSFPFDDAADIHAIIHDMDTGIETEITSDYYIDTVAGTYNYPGYAPGEEAPLTEQPAVLTSTQKIVIYRATPQTQLIDLGEKYPLPVIEKISDKLTLILQEHKEQLGRAIKVALGSDTVPDQLMAELNQAVINAVAASQEAMAQSGAAGESAAAAADSATSAASSATSAASSATSAAGSVTAAQQVVETAAADITAKALAEARAYGLPVGTIVPYGANGDLPSGFLLCDGASVPREMYPDLFAVIGTNYGAVDEAHFNLPNLMDEFIQYSSMAGIKKEAGLPNIKSTISLDYGEGKTDGAFKQAFRNGIILASNNYATTKAGQEFNASYANPIYGNSTTVQPPAITARPIIKAFDGVTINPAVIDVSHMAAELAMLSAKVDTKYGDNDFTIIYPNGGSETSPANVTNNSRYVMENPFSGYEIECRGEIQVNGVWGDAGEWSDGTDRSFGLRVAPYGDDSVVLQTGYVGVTIRSMLSMSSFGNYQATSAPCRVKVWKIGKA